MALGLQAEGADRSRSIDWPASLRAKRGSPLGIDQLRYKPALPDGQALHVFALDCSASMVQSGAFAHAKGLLLQWLRWAYLRRATVAVLCFGAGQVQWRLLPQRAAQWNGGLIDPLDGGGGTPLQPAVHSAWATLHKRQESSRHLWLLSDFRSADVLALEHELPPQGVQHVLCNYERKPAAGVRARHFEGAKRLANAWDASCVLQTGAM